MKILKKALKKLMQILHLLSDDYDEIHKDDDVQIETLPKTMAWNDEDLVNNGLTALFWVKAQET